MSDLKPPELSFDERVAIMDKSFVRGEPTYSAKAGQVFFNAGWEAAMKAMKEHYTRTTGVSL